MTIGELARRAECTAETIRYYEQVGVLPTARRGGGGYRRYTDADVARVGFVRRARDLGFSLDEIRELLSVAERPERACADIDRIARARLAQVEEKLARLAALRSELERTIGACRGGASVAECRIFGALSGAHTSPSHLVLHSR